MCGFCVEPQFLHRNKNRSRLRLTLAFVSRCTLVDKEKSYRGLSNSSPLQTSALDEGSLDVPQTRASLPTALALRLRSGSPDETFHANRLPSWITRLRSFFPYQSGMEKKELKLVIRQTRRFLKASSQPPYYLYAYEYGFSVPYRFRFDCTQKRMMKRLIRGLRHRNFRCRIWRPSNGTDTKKTA